MNIKDQLQHKIDFKTKPLGALGRLEEIALQIGIIQNRLSPKLEKPALLVFAADHGLADEGISPFPKEVTWQMVMNFCAGGAAINVFCRQNGIDIKVIDAGVDYDFPGGLPFLDAKIAKGTRNMLHQPAMSVDECRQAMEKGKGFVKAEAENGCNTIAFGEMGIGNTSASALLMHKFTGISIEECTGKGAGLNDENVVRKKKILKEISEKYQVEKPLDILATFGGFEIAMMVGAFLEAKKQNMVVLVDGFIATAAALTASRFDKTVTENCIFCHTSKEKGHQLMAEYLGAKPLLDIGMRLGEGSGAAVAFPIVKSAVLFLNEMSSFEDAGVSNKE
ncbi:Nicotinate-nucleotide--dimethylbenzimidazole phosphoribosyltransferase [hydrothermal vent metagenome]|uniref:Nicotinate-nucleotide--dimethylbenzimidazole phosphoribosyltransferase n=1 Tax=hydrothermal vent metagenome TaxID=652676 RepID=A0A3B0T6M5_9ZZZZ